MIFMHTMYVWYIIVSEKHYSFKHYVRQMKKTMCKCNLKINWFDLIISEACSDPHYCKNGGVCHLDHGGNVCDCQGGQWVGDTCAYRKFLSQAVFLFIPSWLCIKKLIITKSRFILKFCKWQAWIHTLVLDWTCNFC